ncbi:MAG: hypothetical protein LIO46_02370 [Clostridiales bacterium]|nr:hypothetical protein [Clostridiales bacterium]
MEYLKKLTSRQELVSDIGNYREYSCNLWLPRQAHEGLAVDATVCCDTVRQTSDGYLEFFCSGGNRSGFWIAQPIAAVCKYENPQSQFDRYVLELEDCGRPFVIKAMK